METSILISTRIIISKTPAQVRVEKEMGGAGMR
jgi:hypothetical protein